MDTTAMGRTTPPSPAPVPPSFLHLPPTSTHLALLAKLGDSGPVPTTQGEAVQRIFALKMQAYPTQGLAPLIRAWQEASLAARQAFRQWVNAPPLEDVAPLRTSTQTQRYAAEITRICGKDAVPVS